MVLTPDTDDIPGDGIPGPFIQLWPVTPHLCGLLELMVAYAVIEGGRETSGRVVGHARE